MMKQLKLFTMLFLSCGFIYGQVGQLTNGEIFDFQPGDELHYERYWDQAPEYLTSFIIHYTGRTQINDTIFYDYSYLSIDGDTTHVSNATNGISNITRYQQIFDDTSLVITNFSSSTGYNNRIFNDIDYYEDIPDYMEPESYQITYGEGLGLVNAIASGQSGDVITTLKYYKKDTEEWGLPFVWTSIAEPGSIADNLMIYPNPAHNAVYIQLSEYSHHAEPLSIEIYDATGRLVFKDWRLYQQEEFKVPFNHAICNGVHYLHVTAGQNTFVKKILVSR